MLSIRRDIWSCCKKRLSRLRLPQSLSQDMHVDQANPPWFQPPPHILLLGPQSWSDLRSVDRGAGVAKSNGTAEGCSCHSSVCSKQETSLCNHMHQCKQWVCHVPNQDLTPNGTNCQHYYTMSIMTVIRCKECKECPAHLSLGLKGCQVLTCCCCCCCCLRGSKGDSVPFGDLSIPFWEEVEGRPRKAAGWSLSLSLSPWLPLCRPPLLLLVVSMLCDMFARREPKGPLLGASLLLDAEVVEGWRAPSKGEAGS